MPAQSSTFERGWQMFDASDRPVSTQEGTKMSNALDREMAKLAALGITVSTKLANPNRDTPMRRIGEAAEHAGIAYDPDAYCVICHRRATPEGQKDA